MMHMLSLLVPALWGYLLILLCFRKKPALHPGFVLPLSVTVGFGATVAVSFFSLLIFRQYSREAVLAPVITLAALTLIYTLVLHKKGKLDFIYPRSFKWAYVFFVLVWSVLAWGIYFIATTQPYGDWDAWAIWNMKARFIIYGGEGWKNIFTEMHWHTHPDYPLYLPVLTAWVYAWAGEPFTTAPFVITVFWAVACGILLFGCLRQFVPKSVAFIAATMCMAHPYYVFLATGQYADIIIAYYLLSAFALCVFAFRHKSAKAALLMGFCLGTMAFVKNEGLAMAGLLCALCGPCLLAQKDFTWKRKAKMAGRFLSALAVGLVPALVLRVFLAPSNDDILPDLTWESVKMTDWNVLNVLRQAFLAELLGRPWTWAWPFIGALLLLGIRAIFHRECKIMSLFFICYIAVVLGIYIFTQRDVSLQWWLDFSLRRILLTQFPAMLFLAFYAHWRGKPEEKKEPHETPTAA